MAESSGEQEWQVLSKTDCVDYEEVAAKEEDDIQIQQQPPPEPANDEKKMLEEKEAQIVQLQRELEQVTSRMEIAFKELAETREREMLWKMSCKRKIAYSSFQPEDIVLFLPSKQFSGQYTAFNEDSQYYFLSEECLHNFREQTKNGLPVLGQIVAVDERKAQNDAGNNNPFGLAPGTRYNIVMVCPAS